MNQINRGRRPRPNPADDPHGILLVDKPGGLTSHDVVARIRSRFHLAKVGHGGTLDPQATGLLVILLGRGTKLSQMIMGHDKTYEGVMHLGITTDTQDADGKVLLERDASSVTQDALQAAMRKMIGDQMQVPPMVSAIKMNGVPLYKLARKGQEVEREPRFIHIYEFSTQAIEWPRVTFHLCCTKGTYVRTICADVGEALGCGAFLESLRRTRSGAFDVADSTPLDTLLEWTPETLAERLIPLHQMARDGA